MISPKGETAILPTKKQPEKTGGKTRETVGEVSGKEFMSPFPWKVTDGSYGTEEEKRSETRRSQLFRVIHPNLTNATQGQWPILREVIPGIFFCRGFYSAGLYTIHNFAKFLQTHSTLGFNKVVIYLKNLLKMLDHKMVRLSVNNGLIS